MFKIGQKVEVSIESWEDFCDAFVKVLPRGIMRYTDNCLTVSARGYSALDFYRLRKITGVIELDFDSDWSGWYVVSFNKDKAWLHETMLRPAKENLISEEVFLNCLLL